MSQDVVFGDHGLSQGDVAELARIFEPYRPSLTSVGIFGSRATGTYRQNSDLDLVLFGAISRQDVSRLRIDLEESRFSLPADIIAYNAVSDDVLRAHIDRAGKMLFVFQL